MEKGPEYGAVGILDLEYLEMDKTRERLMSLASKGIDFGIRADPTGEKIMVLMGSERPPGLKTLVCVSKGGIGEMVRRGIYDTAKGLGISVYQEVCDVSEAVEAARCGADGVIARGSEAGGRVGTLPTIELVGSVKAEAKGPKVLALGDIGLGDIGAFTEAGADGFVLDSQIIGLPDHASRVRGMASSTVLIMEDIGKATRISLEGSGKRIAEMDSRMRSDGVPGKERYKAIRAEIETAMSSGKDPYLLLGEGARKHLSSIHDLSSLGGKRTMEAKGTGPETRPNVTVDGRPVPRDYYEKAIAVIGIGSVFPNGIGNDNYWKMILDGVDACREVPPDRWDWKLHYDPDPSVPYKTYSKIGTYITGLEMDYKEFKIPPKAFNQIDRFQRFTIRATKEALIDARILDRKDLDRARIGCVIANAGGGEKRDWAAIRTGLQEIEHWTKQTEAWKELPADLRDLLLRQLRERVEKEIFNVDEDTMPGALANISSGRLANIFDFNGPNFITDAACASTHAAIYSTINELLLDRIDIGVTGGTDSGHNCHVYIEFCKIGALTPDGSRPFSDGANGFLMGEGAGTIVLKRLDDAVRDGDRIYAVIKGIAGSSDGKGKGITAPNPRGQSMAVKKALEDARVDPSTISFLEAHGTSTAVGDVAELMALMEVFKGLPKNSLGLTSVKSQIGHLKAAAGAAGIIKAILAIKNRTLPPQINFEKPNHYFDWGSSPFYVITKAMPWQRIKKDIPRRCGVSSFGFGGTNFHVVMEEFDRDIYDAWKAAASAKVKDDEAPARTERSYCYDRERVASYMREKGGLESEVFLFSSDDPMELLKKAQKVATEAKDAVRLRDVWERPSTKGRYRLAIATRDASHLQDQVDTLKKVGMNEKALMALAAKGIFVGDKERSKDRRTAFMFPGQGSQYINMFRDLSEKYASVKRTFLEADAVMKEYIENPLSSYVFRDVEIDTPEYREATAVLTRTEFNQPAMLTADTAMYKLLISMGVRPDIVMGHSLGEYGALIASGALSFKDALIAVSARGREMRDLNVEDPGKMASIGAGVDEVEKLLKEVDGYVIAANKNCYIQTVIAGETKSMEKAMALFKEKGIEAQYIPVSHAFHSGVVAPVRPILRSYLEKLDFRAPNVPLLANVNGDYYPSQGDPAEVKERILDLLEEQVAASVEWIKQVKRARTDGCNVFIEVGPKRALSSFAYNILEEEVKKGSVFPVTSNHPKKGGIFSFNEMIGSLWAIGYDLTLPEKDDPEFFNREYLSALDGFKVETPASISSPSMDLETTRNETIVPTATTSADPGPSRDTVGFESFMSAYKDDIERFLRDLYDRMPRSRSQDVPAQAPVAGSETRVDVNLSGSGVTLPTRKGVDVVISGASMGLPGRFKKVFSEDNFDLLIEGRNLIEPIDEPYLSRFIAKNIIRLDKKADGSAEMIKLDDESKVARLAGMLGEFDLVKEFGVPESLSRDLDITTQLAFAAGFLALRDAGIPMVRRYSQTTTGSYLPEGWELPIELQEDTGIIFASAFPGHDNLFQYLRDYHNRGPDYKFPRHLMFAVLAMGHSQFAQYIKAKGPNTQVNSACASTTLAIGIAQDWIQTGRCKRVIVLGTDDPASSNNLEWFGSSLLAMGALTPEKDVTKAAVPFDSRRAGMIIGSGAVGLVLEAEEEPRRRGMVPLVELLGSHIGNSAFHGSRLDIAHIARSMDRFMTRMEREHGIDRKAIAPELAFMSHETYTPARGGSSAAEVEALRRTFGERFRDILIMNTKGYTGHAFGCCIEDPALIRSLETGKAIPLSNLDPKHIDPQFEGLNLSRGGSHNRRYGLRLGAGFGSQLAFLLMRRPVEHGRFSDKARYNEWLDSIATTKPVEIETADNILRLKDQGMANLMAHRAIRRESSEIGFIADLGSMVTSEEMDHFKKDVLRIFSEKTGIPADMIDIDADLETDLGFDSVKQVELFAAARIFFELPKDEGVNIRDYQTLRKVIQYIASKKASMKKTLVPEVVPARGEETPRWVEGGSGFDQVAEKVLNMVSEKTGYPRDMLDLDLDLEADLGIDTVKQVELFASARGEFDLPRDDTVNLKDFPTLRHIIGYVIEKKGVGSNGALPSSGTLTVGTTQVDDTERVKDRIIEIVAEKTGYPKDMLDPDLDLEADLGIDTVKQVELFASARGEFDLPRDDTVNLKDFPTLRHIIQYVASRRGSTTPAPVSVQKKKDEPVQEAPKERVIGGPGSRWEAVKDRIVAIVADKTGYPLDMLELDLDLEADLGIDTVKQVELFASARGEFDLPRDDTVNLKDFPTLRHIVDYVAGKVSDGPAVAIVTPTLADGSIIAPSDGEARTGTDHWEMVRERIITIVAEKTGYPDDMLELDQDLEADLGIDTVKQVELFASARGEFDLPRDDTVNLKDFPTLRHIIDYVAERSQGMVQEAAPAAPLSVTDLKNRINRWVLFADPAPALKGSRPLPLAGKKLALFGSMDPVMVKDTLGCDAVPVAPEDVLADRIDLTQFQGLLALHMMDSTFSPLSDDWKVETDRSVLSLFKAAKAMGPVLKKGGVFVSMTAMGGRFGTHTSVDPLNGAVSGLTKAIKREYPSSVVTVFDVRKDLPRRKALEMLSAELGQDKVHLEVGWDGRRFLPALRIVEPASPEVFQLRDGMKLLISGGGTGITSEIVREIARMAKLDLHILGRTELPRNIKDLSSLDDRGLADLRDKIKESLKKEHKQVTPVMLEREFTKVEKAITVQRLLDDIKAAGSKAHYHALDVTDGKAISQIGRKYGPFHGVLHAAGVEQSKLISGKTESDFSLVFDTKILGARNLIEATKDHPLEFFVSFSSVAGRFGNNGQVDYSAANDMLDKMWGTIRSAHPRCLVKAVGWSAWADIGMASRGSVKTLLELGGISFIPVKDGVKFAISELTSGAEKEVFYAGSMGPLDADGLMKWEEGVIPPTPWPIAPLLDSVRDAEGTKIFSRRLDGRREIFLNDHRIMNVQVLPGSMGLEMFAEASSRVLLGKVSLRDVHFNRPVNVDPVLDIELTARSNDLGQLEMELASNKGDKRTVHFTAKAVPYTAERPPRVTGHPLKPTSARARIASDEIYEHLFLDNLYHVLDGAEVLGDGEFLGVFRPVKGDLLDPGTGFSNDGFEFSPMHVELGFQLAGAYILDRFRIVALPVSVGSVDVHEPLKVTEKALAHVRFRGKEGKYYSFDVDILDLDGHVRVSYRDYRLGGLMPNEHEVVADAQFPFESVQSPDPDIDIIAVDTEALSKDLASYRNCFGDDWDHMFGPKMVDKRRKEHLAGRLAAKAAVAYHLSTSEGRFVRTRDVRILTEGGGRPYAMVDDDRYEISISHSRRWALCSVHKGPHGCDIESTEPREPSFQEEAFTDHERKLMQKLNKQLPLTEDMTVTLLFSAKEAFLKMLGIGLGKDLRSVRVKKAEKTDDRLSMKLSLEHDGMKAQVMTRMFGAYVVSTCKE